MPKVVAIIPARLASTRLPGKMLLADTGQPLIQYAWQNARAASLVDDVIVATDSDEIEAAVEKFGGRVERTGAHPTGSDRIAEVVERCCGDAEIIVNLQGDEPELPPATIDRVVSCLCRRPEIPLATLATPISDMATLLDRSCVKVARAVDGRALYFSRLPIPCYRDGEPQDLFPRPANSAVSDDETSLLTRAGTSPWLHHMGIYAYRREFLLAFTRMPPSPLEQLESLEQLRALEAGASILVDIVPERSEGIDTAADYQRFVARIRGREAD